MRIQYKRCFIAIPAVCLLGVLFVAGQARGEVQERPNVLFIVSDDQGWDDVGYHNPEIRTPHLDRLAKEGVELDCHYVQPQCTPTRVALMTGRYPSRFGPDAVKASNKPAFPVGTPTMAKMFKAAGYTTGMSGKWHLGSKPEWGPNQHGFDYSHGSLAGAVGMYDHRYRLDTPFALTWHRNHEIIEEEGHVTDLTAGEAVKWIRQHQDSDPWFFYVPFHAVHTPLVEKDPKWHEMNKHIEDPDRRLFSAALSHMDWAVGEMVKALEETGQRENTLIIFTSDNGGVHGKYKGGNYPDPDPTLAAGFSSNKPLRGGKTQAYEGGIRVPAFANWKGKLQPSKMTAPMHVVDWLPTLATLIGEDAKAALPKKLDGRDVWPLLTGEADRYEAPRTLYWIWGWGKSRDWEALRHGDWKIVRRQKKKWELFNLAEDPGESNNLADANQAVLKDLSALYRQMRAEDAATTR